MNLTEDFSSIKRFAGIHLRRYSDFCHDTGVKVVS